MKAVPVASLLQNTGYIAVYNKYIPCYNSAAEMPSVDTVGFSKA